jgi:hypothetical protein
MNKLFGFIAVFGLISFSACAQKLKSSQVPAPAKAAFAKQYPGVAASWEKEDGNYEVNFKRAGKTMSAVINKDGTILETETDIAVAGLPQAAKDYIKTHYAGKKIREASKIVKANGAVEYEALINGKDVMFDSNGKFIEIAKD